MIPTKMLIAQLPTVQTAQPRHGHNADKRILVLVLTGAVHDQRSCRSEPLAHRDRFHVVHSVIVEQANAVVLAQQLVRPVDPEE